MYCDAMCTHLNAALHDRGERFDVRAQSVGFHLVEQAERGDGVAQLGLCGDEASVHDDIRPEDDGWGVGVKLDEL